MNAAQIRANYAKLETKTQAQIQYLRTIYLNDFGINIIKRKYSVILNRLRIMIKVGRVECKFCRCYDPRLLQLDHIDGNAMSDELKEYDGSRGAYFLHLAAMDNRSLSQKIQILCHNCHQMKHGSLGWRSLSVNENKANKTSEEVRLTK